jgi:hypothetical protein
MTNDEIADLFEQWYNDKVRSPAIKTGELANDLVGHA